MKKIDIKKLLFYILITFVIGSLFAVLSNNDFYKGLIKPFNLKPVVFPLVWSILFLLMSISAYMVSYSKECNKIYFTQLIFNSIWTLIFFGFKNFLLAFIDLVILLILVIIMIYKFYKERKIAGLINIPYVGWLLIAGYLNLYIALMN